MLSVNPALRSMPASELQARLAGDAGLVVETGPFKIRVRCRSTKLAAVMSSCYPDYAVADGDSFADVAVEVRYPRRPLRKRGGILIDDGVPFTDFDGDDALPYMEWAVNWCIAMRAHRFVMMHSGVVERNGAAILFPGAPGSGKSTLSAFLAFRGWRLLSDEFGLVDPADCSLVAFPRLIPLKNESIDVIRAAVPQAQLGPVFSGTRKGDVAHVVPPADHVQRSEVKARPAALVFPRFEQGADSLLEEISKPEAFVNLSHHSFNYKVMGSDGFTTLATLVDRCGCYRLRFGSLHDAEAALLPLVAGEDG